MYEVAGGDFTEDDFEPVIVWPENQPAFECFRRVQITQWRHGFNGPTGLDYAALYPLLDRHADRSTADWLDLLDDVQVIELAALEQMRKNRDSQ
jgi:hypothetical protein